MIVKGRTRSGPAQLAAYLLREDGKERATLIQLFDGDEDLHKAFTQWHAIGEGTRGEKTLYHAQIAPEARYGMTPDEWKRAAEILAEELGMQDHPRAIVVHEGGKNPHAHVVFQRADADSMTMWDDSFNYQKHERASKRMEEEFAHEPVPGKHDKRDRDKQPEFPRSQTKQEDHQQAARTGMTAVERKAQITALRSASDSAPAFKAALEDAGYVLAKGDKRGLVLVDEQGETFSLSRQVTDLKGREFKAFMAPLDPAQFPAVEQAKVRQEARQRAPHPKPVPEAEKRGVEASKFLQPRTAQRPVPPPSAPEDPELAALLKSLAERQAQEAKEHRDQHAQQLRQTEQALGRELKEKLASFEAIQTEQRQALTERHAEKREGIGGLLDAAKQRLKPAQAAEQGREQRRESAQLERRLQEERKDYLALLEQTRQLEIENLTEKQQQQLRDLDTRAEEERERYIEEHKQAQRILADLKEQQRQEALRRGPEPPTRSK